MSERQKHPCMFWSLKAKFHERDCTTLSFLIHFPTKKPCQFKNLQGQKNLFLRLKYLFPRNYQGQLSDIMKSSCLAEGMIESCRSSLKKKKIAKKKVNLDISEALLPVFKACKQMRLLLLKFFT